MDPAFPEGHCRNMYLLGFLPTSTESESCQITWKVPRCTKASAKRYMAIAMGYGRLCFGSECNGWSKRRQSSGSRAVKEVTQMSMAKKMYFTVLRGATRAVGLAVPDGRERSASSTYQFHIMNLPETKKNNYKLIIGGSLSYQRSIWKGC